MLFLVRDLGVVALLSQRPAAGGVERFGKRAVGRTPWQPAFPVAGVTGLRVVQEFREAQQKPNETPMVRVFEVINALSVASSNSPQPRSK